MTNHLNALNLRISSERSRLASAKSAQEIELRKVWVAGIEKEIAAERVFLGFQPEAPIADILDDDLLKQLCE